jgi:hypothetical protein
MNNKVLTSGFNNLYDPIFCNLFNTNDGFMQVRNSNFGNNMITDSNHSFSTQSTENNCLEKCKDDKWCTSYSFDISNGQCTEYTNFPSTIVNNINGINSGYNLSVSYNYNSLTPDQQNVVRTKCTNQYLNDKFIPKNPHVDLSSCFTINNPESSTSTISTNAQCLYNIYNSEGIPVKIKDNSNYIDNPSFTTSKSDSIIDNYETGFNNYTSDQNKISNINNILTPLDLENSEYNEMVNQTNSTVYNQYISTINNKSDQINSYSDNINRRIGLENFENEYNNNIYKNSAKFIILFIIILFLWYIILMVSK